MRFKHNKYIIKKLVQLLPRFMILCSNGEWMKHWIFMFFDDPFGDIQYLDSFESYLLYMIAEAADTQCFGISIVDDVTCREYALGI